MSSSGAAGAGGGEPGTVVAGLATGTDDSDALNALLATLLPGGTLRLRPGVTYLVNGGLNVPTLVPPVTIDARGSTIQEQTGSVAGNIFNASGAWTLIGGTFDGNRSATTDPGVISNGNGVHQVVSAAGWSGKVRLLGGPVFKNFWSSGIYLATDLTALTDADNAPPSAAYLDHVEVTGCNRVALRLDGVTDVELESPYSHDNTSHGIRTFLCRRQSTRDAKCISNGGHGMSSLYCTDQRIDGQFDLNGSDGLVIGGDSTSTTNAPGRRFKIGRVTARGNTSHGLCLDATISGSTAVVPVYGSVDAVLAENNGGDGVIITSSQYVDLGRVDANGNTGHGLDIASNAVSWRFARCMNNGQKGIALQGSAGSPNCGNHDAGGYYLSGNTPDDTWTIGTVLAASRFATAQSAGLSAPPAALGRVYNAQKAAALTRSNTATLAADPDLQFASIDPGTYLFDAYLPYDATTTGDIAFGLNLPAGASISWGGDGPAGTIAAGNPTAILINRVEFTTATGPAAGGANVGTGTYALARGVLLVPTAGSFALKWAQNTAEVSNCTLHALAAIRLTQIA